MFQPQEEKSDIFKSTHNKQKWCSKCRLLKFPDWRKWLAGEENGAEYAEKCKCMCGVGAEKAKIIVKFDGDTAQYHGVFVK